ncbi:MAG: hypothetical protein ACOC80_14495 [Petrotogales bacterium]
MYNEITKILPKPTSSFDEAIKLVKDRKERMPIGIFNKVKKPVFHKELMGDWNPVQNKMSRNERLKKIEEFV